MSREIRTIRGAIYVVTPTEDGSISTADGTIISSFAVGRQTPFVSPSQSVIVSDERAAVDIYLNTSTPIALGDGALVALRQHREDASAHLTPAERRCLAAYVPHFAEAAAAEAEEESLAAALSEDAEAQETTDMNTDENTSWLTGLLTGWGIKESWAKIIAGALVGALAAAGFLTGC